MPYAPRLATRPVVAIYLLVITTACPPPDRPPGPTGNPPPSPKAASLEFVSQPTKSFSDSLFRPAVRVMVKDQNGAAFTTPVQVTIALGTPAAGVSLANTSGTTGADGTATFDNLRVTGAGTGLSLRAEIASGSATPALSNTFDVAPAPVIADSTRLKLVSDSAARASGTYVFQAAAGAPTPKVGGVLVGGDGGGYLIKVKSVQTSGATVTVQGDQAALTDAVRSGSLRATTSRIFTEGPQRERAASRITWGPTTFHAPAGAPVVFNNGRVDFNQAVLYGTPSNGLTINGYFQFDPGFTLDLDIDNFVIQKLSAVASGEATLSATLGYNATGSWSPTIPEVEAGVASKPFVVFLGPWPVYGRVIVKFVLVPELKADATVGISTTATATAGLSVGASYAASGGWQFNAGPTSSSGFTFTPPSPTISGGASAKLGVRVELRLLLYEVLGPYVWATPYLGLGANVDVANSTWSSYCTSAIELGVGFSARIFSYALVDYNKKDDFLKTQPPICTKSGSLFASHVLALDDGNAQTAPPGTALRAPLSVKVTRAGGVAAPGVAVQWVVTGGSGTVSDATSTTGSDGVASTSWTLGPNTGTNTLEARLSGATGSPVRFTATGVLQGTLSGLVVDDLTGAAIGDATVAFVCGTANYGTVLTNAQGRFTSPQLPAGPCGGTVAKVSYSVLDLPPTTVRTGLDTPMGALRLQKTQVGDLGGVVRNSQGNTPIAGALVELWAGSNTPNGAPLATTAANSSGAYQFRGLTSGPYTLRANAPGFTLGPPVTKQVDAAKSNTQDLTLTPQPSGGTITLADFVLIPAGQFQMGSSTGGFAAERPVHTVNITRPFYMQKTEVTQAQWQAVMGTNPSLFKTCGPDCPVEQVSWDDIQVFLAKLNQANPGATYRLPTEAEWEYAARAGTTGDYGGAGVLDQMGLYSGNAGSRTHPVAQKLPNAWGLYDMHGNAYEWVQDWYGAYQAAAVSDPLGPANGTYRVRRGGSWAVAATYARSAYRFDLNVPSTRSSHIGFRLARWQ